MPIEIKYVSSVPREEDDKRFEDLAKSFNSIAKLHNSKYKIVLNMGYPFIIQRVWFFQNFTRQIEYNHNRGCFEFVDGIGEEVLSDIQPIMNEIPENFYVEMEKGGDE